MDSITPSTDALLWLAIKWRRHNPGLLPCVNSLWAQFRVNSPIGYRLDKSSVRNSGVPGRLQNIAWSYGPEAEKAITAALQASYAPSPAAANMLKYGICRRQSRCQPMSPETNAAVLAWLDEHIELLAETVSNIEQLKFRSRLDLRKTRRELKTWREITAMVTESPSPAKNSIPEM